MLLTVLSLEAVGLGAAVGAADGLGGAADGLGVACGAVDGLTGTISADTTPLGALRDRSSLGFVSIGCLGSGGGRERERGSVDAGMSDCASMMAGTLSNLPVFFLGGGLDASRPTDPIWYTSGLFGAALTGP
jgi:hypothetical protein